MTRTIKSDLIAPCGMNCAICLGYLREENTCPGCFALNTNTKKSTACTKCIIRKCTKRKGKYCFSCDTYPCTRLKQLDKRYRTKYKMSMLENLENIKQKGIRAFVKNEKTRWACCGCKGLVCVHRGFCLICEKNKKT